MKSLTTLTFFLFTLTSFAQQVEYNYDDADQRVQRTEVKFKLISHFSVDNTLETVTKKQAKIITSPKAVLAFEPFIMSRTGTHAFKIYQF